MDKEGFGVYGAPDRTFTASNMASGDLRLTDSAADTAGSHFSSCPGPGMDYGDAAADAAIYVQMMHHPLFDGDATCHCVSSG